MISESTLMFSVELSADLQVDLKQLEQILRKKN